jgi:hypothetical protein
MSQIEATERAITATQSAEHSARNAEIEAIKAVSAAAERVSSGRRALDVAIQEERPPRAVWETAGKSTSIRPVGPYSSLS